MVSHAICIKVDHHLFCFRWKAELKLFCRQNSTENKGKVNKWESKDQQENWQRKLKWENLNGRLILKLLSHYFLQTTTECITNLDWTFVKVMRSQCVCHFWPLFKMVSHYLKLSSTKIRTTIVKLSFSKILKHTVPVEVVIVNNRCQFHQHFTHAFFVDILAPKITNTQLCIFWRQNFVRKTHA